MFLSGALLGLFGAIFIENTLNGDAYYEAIIPLAIVAGSLGVMSLVMLVRANKLLPFCANVGQSSSSRVKKYKYWKDHNPIMSPLYSGVRGNIYHHSS